MTRDRLADLRANMTEDESVVIMMAGQVENADTISAFASEVEKIKSGLDELERIVEDISKLQTSILSTHTPDDNSKSQLYGLMNECKGISGRVRKKLSEIDAGLQEIKKTKGANCAEFRIRNTQYTMLLKKFMEIMGQYNLIQVDYRERCKNRIQRQLEITGRSTTKEELDDLLETGNTAIFTEGIVTDTKQAIESLREIEARHKDIIKLESSIRDLHEMFIEMGSLVEHQGDLVDVIQNQVERTKDFVLNANDQITEALVTKSKLARRKLCCFSILIVFIVLLVFTLFSEFLK